MTGTISAIAPPFARQGARGLDSELLRQWLERVFSDFYNAIFDATYRGGAAHDQAGTLDLVRRMRAQQDAIIDAVAVDLALLLADPAAGGIVVPFRGNGELRPQRWQRQLHEAFAQRCARLRLESVDLALLETAFEHQLIARLEQMACGVAAVDTCAMSTRAPAGAPLPPSATAEAPEQIARMVSRLRAGGLKLMQVKSEIAPASAAAPLETAPAATAGPAVADRPARRRPSAVLVLGVLLALAALALDVVRRDGPEPQQVAIPLSTPPVAVAAVPVAESPPPAVPVAESPPPAVVNAVPESPAPPIDAPPPLPDPRLQQQIFFLLERAELAFGQLRLSEPFADSATANFLAVLALDPAHPEARAGLQRVAQRYAELINAAQARGATAQAELLRARASSLPLSAEQPQTLAAD